MKALIQRLQQHHPVKGWAKDFRAHNLQPLLIFIFDEICLRMQVIIVLIPLDFFSSSVVIRFEDSLQFVCPILATRVVEKVQSSYFNIFKSYFQVQHFIRIGYQVWGSDPHFWSIIMHVLKIFWLNATKQSF